MSEKCRPTSQEYRKLWSQRLRPRAPPPFKPPRVNVKPKCKVKRVNWCLPGLHSIAQFLRDISPEGPPCTIVEKVSETKAVYVIGTTLHVHVLQLRKKDELSFILLATHLRLVDEVRIHNFHINYYLTARRVHVRLVPAYWRTVKSFLPYINRGPWVEREGKRERAVKITFDNFLRPAVEAWKAGLPYHHLVLDIPEYKTDLISTYTNLSYVHLGLNFLIRGYSSESDFEVKVVHDTLHESDEEDEIMMVLVFPFFPLGAP